MNKEKLRAFYKEALSKEGSLINRIVEHTVMNLYTSFLQPGDVAVDIGAHNGEHAVKMAMLVGKTGKVYAFEPIPEIFALLKKNVRGSGAQACVEAHNAACSNFSGESQFVHVLTSCGLSGLKDMPHQRDLQKSRIKVRVEQLDDIVKDRVSFIKIDAEGGDFYALQGARRILASDRPLIAFESGMMQKNPSSAYGYTREEFTAFFEGLNYELFNISGLSYDSALWDDSVLWEMVVIPSEKSRELRDIFVYSILKTLYSNLRPA